MLTAINLALCTVSYICIDEFMFSWPLHDGRRFAGSSAEGGWTVTLHRRNKPNTCHRADFQQLVVHRGGAYVTRRRTHLLFCIQTGKRWRYCHENSNTHLGFCCLYLLNCPDNSLEVSWGISCSNCNFCRRFFGITDTPQKWEFKRLELYKLLWFYEKFFDEFQSLSHELCSQSR